MAAGQWGAKECLDWQIGSSPTGTEVYGRDVLD